MELKCGMCKKFTGIGDWNICCTEIHDPKKFPFGVLFYEDNPACDKFDPIKLLTEEEFYEKYCKECGTQRCGGIGTERFGRCIRRYELKGYSDNQEI